MTIKDLKTGRAVSFPPPFVAALGDFDGVHIGHRRVVEETLGAAGDFNAASAAWFFGESPKGGAVLTDADEKDAIFSALGIRLSLREDFGAVRDLSPERFVFEYLAPLGCRAVVCGFNFRFGKGASGNTEKLKELCEAAGMGCRVVPPVCLSGSTVSSSAIRERLAEGDVEGANGMLGRAYSVRSAVTHGRTLGSKLGFPTVNQSFSAGRALPRRGVYFTYTEADGRKMPSVSNVGSRPTVGGHELRLETHILDYEGDLYGDSPRVSFLKFRRPEKKFGSEKELAAAVADDAAAAREFFAKGESGKIC